ncbi:MAG: peptidoglycan-associated lipoprotein Pal [Pigmentiphaga sp.]
MNHPILKTFAVVGFSAVLAACGSSVKLDDSAGTGSGATGAGSTGVASGGVDQNSPFNPQSPLAQQRSVFFEFDSYSIPEQYRSVVEMHARYLAANPQQQVVIEGNTDQRGSSEYNLALGQRRSEAVRRTALLLGAQDQQIEAISFGKERPKAHGTTEADFAENRRADFSYRR